MAAHSLFRNQHTGRRTLGAGVEYAFIPAWSARFEYRYTAAASLELSHISGFRPGVNYRFGGL